MTHVALQAIDPAKLSTAVLAVQAAAVAKLALFANVDDPVTTSIAVAVAATLVNGAITLLNLWISHREKQDTREKEALKAVNDSLHKEVEEKTKEVAAHEAEEDVLRRAKNAAEAKADRLESRVYALENVLDDHQIKFRRWTDAPADPQTGTQIRKALDESGEGQHQ